MTEPIDETIRENERFDTDAAGVRPTNERLLCTAFVSFMGFALIQMVAAFFAKSEAMMGDSVAMCVDALTYLFNWFAERKKRTHADNLLSNGMPTYIGRLEYRQSVHRLELISPTLSVSTLLVVTAIILKQSIHTIIIDTKRDISEQANPNLNLMLIFSCLNMLLDCLNVFCFARAKRALGWQATPDDDVDDDLDGTEGRSMMSLLENGEINNFEQTPSADDEYEGLIRSNDDRTMTRRREHFEIDEMSTAYEGHEEHEQSNLNMCSAYTHVFADTLRSMAVIIAAALAEFNTNITSEEADAAAAIVVSVLIACSLIPLTRGLCSTFQSLRKVDVLLREQQQRQQQQSG